jgi:hypothetical protein
MKTTNLLGMLLRIATLAVLAFVIGCEEPFDPASLIQTRRFLAITATPLEAAPGETVTFRAVVTNEDGSLHEGSIAWTIATGDALRLAGNFEAGDDPVTQSASEPFVWTVPSREELVEQYGIWEERGMLLTVGATAFESADLFGGELVGEPIPAFKLFLVSENDPEDRLVNPVIDKLTVETTSGTQLIPGIDGVYETTSSKVILKAFTDESSDRLSYHWFSTEDDFDPDGKSSQKLDPGNRGAESVYCVMRKTHFFDHDDGTRTRFTGIDWKKADIRFE